MDAQPVRYDRWKAPTEDGKVLLWPAVSDLLGQTIQNHERLSAGNSVLLQNVPLPEARRQMRQWLGHDDERPLIATAHQAELHHPGVWAKNVLVDAVAMKLGGRAYHFAVDIDKPRHLSLRWPGGAVSLIDDPGALASEWGGLLAPPSPAHLQDVEREFHQASAQWGFVPMASEFLSSLRHLAPQSSNLPANLGDALHKLDWSMGLRYDLMLVSPICQSEPYLLFVYHVLARAGDFARSYNAALDQFRREHKIKDAGRPMPNLKETAQSCEAPFWLDSVSTGVRSRASVERVDGNWVLRVGGDEFRFNPTADGWDAAGALFLWLRAYGLRLSPRALTLTFILRLLVADQFVHGIGGAQYDQVLDDLITRSLAIEPPRFAVTTTTLYFPQAVGQTRVCLPCIVQEGHRLKHNVLGEEKLRLAERIAALPRRSPQRAALFYQMHQKLAAAWSPSQIRAWEQRLREAEAQAQKQRVLFDRELFYAIQPRERLTGLIDRYRSFFG